MKKNQWIALMLGCSILGSTYLGWAAPFSGETSGEPVEVQADEMDYNWKTGDVSAKGNLVIVQSGDRAQGQELQYNMDTQTGFIMGNVIATQADGTRLVTSRLDVLNGQVYTSSGGVDYTSPEQSLQADWVQYNSLTGYVQTKGRTTLGSPEGIIKADHVEGWEKTEQVIGRGNVDFNSPAHKAVGRADRVDFSKAGKVQGIVILTGNAHLVHQGENMLTGPKISLDLDTGYAQAEGRPTLVITPQK